MIKKIMAYFLMSTLFITPCFTYANTKQETKETPGTAIFVMAVPTEIHIEDQHYKSTGNYLNIETHYPQLEGLLDKKFQKKMNHYFENHVIQLQKEIKKEAKKQYKEQASDTPLYKYELISNYKTKESLKQYLVIGLFDYIYTGGAHGLPQQSYITLDLSQNEVLTLNQLFDEKMDYKTELKELITNQIEKRTDKKEKFFDDFYDLIHIEENQNFYITPAGDLVLVFNVYEIAPYSTGVVEFTIKKEDLKGYRVDYN
ncbi:MAG: DUF3298 and DUF4163 domain-containing protein [Zhenhengia sp.]|uniref:DUF3298 and DUF4163 domain-containing protein n=1 Tax=Zhenhengia yiwuensis TaxID=2763666 RepID=A0A926IFD2_9FIRM|nr:DUF3298 and DUF4163 domain-containing protein [Zhenhengia yiwuensis]MBC8581587.1 DUF3298 and DUF4163 domain-containing protein [Zhenhengia yiwuensis]MBS5798997.1 DUF3298 and DUF4163 domain-containing protein [Clostridiales bacterium]